MPISSGLGVAACWRLRSSCCHGFTSSFAGQGRRFPNLDGELNRRAAVRPGKTTLKRHRACERRRTSGAASQVTHAPASSNLVNGYLLDVPDAELHVLASNPAIAFASVNGVVQAFNFRTGVQSGAFFARQMMGLTGAGVSVAVLDSGIAPVDDFSNWQGFGRMPGQSRVTFFKDFLVPNSALARTTRPAPRPAIRTGTERMSPAPSPATGSTRSARNRALPLERRSSRCGCSDATAADRSPAC